MSTYTMQVDRIVDFGVDDFLVIPGIESLVNTALFGTNWRRLFKPRVQTDPYI